MSENPQELAAEQPAVKENPVMSALQSVLGNAAQQKPTQDAPGLSAKAGDIVAMMQEKQALAVENSELKASLLAKEALLLEKDAKVAALTSDKEAFTSHLAQDISRSGLYPQLAVEQIKEHDTAALLLSHANAQKHVAGVLGLDQEANAVRMQESNRPAGYVSGSTVPGANLSTESPEHLAAIEESRQRGLNRGYSKAGYSPQKAGDNK